MRPLETQTSAPALQKVRTASSEPTTRAAALHLFVLFNFAVSQPLFDRLTERLAYFGDLNLPAWVIFCLTLVLSLGLPAVLVFFVRLAGFAGRRQMWAVHTASLTMLSCLLVMPFLKQLGFVPPAMVYLGGIGIAFGSTVCYWKFTGIRTALSLCAWGLPLFPTLFLLHYSSSTLATYAKTQRTERWTPAPVVMIVFDEFCGSSLMTPDRTIDAARFPHFAALARDAHWFRNAASVHEATEHAVPALLSGRYPDIHQTITLARRPQNLFTMLVGAGGYEYAAFEPISRLAPERTTADHSAGSLLTERVPALIATLGRVYLFHLVPELHAHCLPPVPQLWFGVRADHDIDSHAHRGTFRYRWSAHRSRQLAHFLETFEESEAPTVHFMHALLPHVPWSYYPSGRRYTHDGADWELLNLGNDNDRWSADHLHALHGQQRYLLQLMYADRFIGEVVAKLHETGMYDRALLIVTADHGISFRPDEYRRAANPGNRDEILSIPLFIKRPGETAGLIHDQPVESVDVFPTMADVLGYQLTHPVDGWSVFNEQRSPRTQTTYYTASDVLKAPVTEIASSPIPNEIRERFGSSDDPAALFHIGPIPAMIGRRVSDFEKVNRSPLTLELTRFSDEWVDDPDLAVPGFYEGRVPTHNPVDEPPVVLAVAVNGVIQAVTRTYRHAAELSQWTALLPEAAFHSGHNDVQFYEVQGQSPEWKLAPCELVFIPRTAT